MTADHVDAELAWAPARAPHVHLGTGGLAHHLVDADGAPLLALDDMAVAILQLCDGATAVAEMVQAMCLIWDASEEEVANDVLEFLRFLVRSGAILPPK